MDFKKELNKVVHRMTEKMQNDLSKAEIQLVAFNYDIHTRDLVEDRPPCPFFSHNEVLNNRGRLEKWYFQVVSLDNVVANDGLGGYDANLDINVEINGKTYGIFKQREFYSGYLSFSNPEFIKYFREYYQILMKEREENKLPTETLAEKLNTTNPTNGSSKLCRYCKGSYRKPDICKCENPPLSFDDVMLRFEALGKTFSEFYPYLYQLKNLSNMKI